MLKVVTVPLPGHADKICDQIVEGIVDEYLRRDPKAAIAIRAMGSRGMLMIGGTVDSRADFDATSLARQIYSSAGYEDDLEPFIHIERPSEEESKAIVSGLVRHDIPVFGYATKETREFLPRPYVIARSIAERLDRARRVDDRFRFLKPDGFVQIGIDGDKMKFVTIHAQTSGDTEPTSLRQSVIEAIVEPEVKTLEGVKLFVNPGAPFIEGGLLDRAGASGSWEAVDSYGGLMPYGGSVVTGRDPFHPSRAGSVMARFVAQELVKRGVASNVLVKLVYLTGQREPYLEVIAGDGKSLTELVSTEFDFRIEAIVERLALQTPMYRAGTAFGWFGRSVFSFE